jgi:DNA repair ATPase RecN
MEDFNAVVADITGQIEERQRALTAAFDQEQRRIQGLRELLKRIGGCSEAFDEEDKAAVLAEIGAREAALQQLQRESRRQEEVRRQKEAILLSLHTVLTTRTKALEQIDEDSSVLKDHETLLAYFARKQVQLTDMLKQRLRELADTMPKP